MYIQSDSVYTALFIAQSEIQWVATLLFCSGVTVHDGMNMTECAAYGTHQPPSHYSDFHKPTDEPVYEEIKTWQYSYINCSVVV